MPFNLRGGRPKNKTQGIYWVQRHVADQRATERAQAASARRAEKERSISLLNDRYRRIVRYVVLFFRENDTFNGNEAAVAKFNSALEAWNHIKQTDCSNGNNVSSAKLNKLATAAKNLITSFAKPTGAPITWLPAIKSLQVGHQVFDLS